MPASTDISRTNELDEMVTTGDVLAGAGAIGFAVLVGASNLLLPNTLAWDASGKDVASWIHTHHAAAAATTSLFAVAAVCLFVFLGGFVTRARRRGDERTEALALTGAAGAVL